MAILLLILLSSGILGWVLIADSQTDSDKLQVENQQRIVLVHGFGRGKMAMWRIAGRLEDAGYIVHRIGYQTINRTVNEVIDDVSKQINDCCIESNTTVHFVGHSMGGLMIRAYLQKNKFKPLGKTVMIGTPNKGTTVADEFKDSHIVKSILPIGLSLGTDASSFPNQLDVPYYPVGIIAGIVDNDSNNGYLPGPDDGLVAVESTKVPGMADFILIETSHTMMRYNEEVAKQVITFLKQGKFEHKPNE